jgi:radical SAM protein with 4Fe4S-binding SPASM domain
MNKLEKYLSLVKKANCKIIDPSNLSLGGFFQFLNLMAHKYHTHLLTPARIQWEVTKLCNLSCKQCYINSIKTRKADELDTEECLKLIKEIKKLDVLWVEIQGGEPFIRKDILIILREIKKCNISVKIATNGTLITEEIAHSLLALLDPATDSIQISLDGSTARINDKIRGDGAFKKTVKAMKICFDIGLKYSVNTTLMDENISDLTNIFTLVNEIGGADKFCFFTLMAVGRGRKMAFTRMEEGLKQYIEVKKIEREPGAPKVKGYLGYDKNLSGYKEAAERIFGNNTPSILNKNTAAISSLDIDSNGDVYPSSYLQSQELKAGSVREQKLIKLWRTNKWKDLREVSGEINGKCKICDLYKYCGGGTVANSYLGRLGHPIADSQCLFEPKIELENVILRPPMLKDADFLKKLWGDPNVMKFVGFPKGMPVSREKVNDWIIGWQDRDRLRLIIQNAQNNKPIGEIGYRVDGKFPFGHTEKVFALDIKIAPYYWGKGIAKKSLAKFIDILSAGGHRIIFQVTPNILNAKAINLYRSLGFNRIGDAKVWTNEFGDVINYNYMILKK